MGLILLDSINVTYHKHSTSYILLIGNKKKSEKIPLIVGYFEAQSIVVALENVPVDTPLVYDVFCNMLQHFSIQIKEVYIRIQTKQSFYAEVFAYSKSEGSEQSFKFRASDAVAFALRTHTPIYIEQEFLDKYGVNFTKGENQISIQESSNIEDLSAEQLVQKLKQAIEEEEYEKAAEIQAIIDKKKNGT